VQAEYGFDDASPYPTLLAVLQRAQAAINEGREVERARAARFLALSYVPREDKLRVQYEFTLQQPSYEHKASAAQEIHWLIGQGLPHDPALDARIADTLCADLSMIRERGGVISAFVGHSLHVLLLLKDPRALDIALTDRTTMNNLKLNDGWDPDDGPEFFAELARQYRQEAPRLAPRAALYELMAARRAEGRPLEPASPVFDLEAYRKLTPQWRRES
jgi:hypothetical protein